MSQLIKSFKDLGYDIHGLDNVCYSDSPAQTDACIEGYANDCISCDSSCLASSS